LITFDRIDYLPFYIIVFVLADIVRQIYYRTINRSQPVVALQYLHETGKSTHPCYNFLTGVDNDA